MWAGSRLYMGVGAQAVYHGCGQAVNCVKRLGVGQPLLLVQALLLETLEVQHLQL